ncbi:MAG: hypothetical protein ABIQ73_16520 [Acidimicrobiales bacterium]
MRTLTVAVLSGILLAGACTSNRGEPATATTQPQIASTEPPSALAARDANFIDGHWEELPNQGGVHDLVWSGRELLLYGYEVPNPLPSIRVFDPSTTAVRSFPVPGPARSGASTTWTGSELLVIGGRPEAADVALRDFAFDPTTGGWRALAPSPLSARHRAPIVWTGREAIVVSGFDARLVIGSEPLAAGGAAYDPTTDTWRAIADPGDLAAGDHLVNKALWTGTEVVVWGTRNSAATGPTGAMAAYNPATDSWRELAKPPVMSVGGEQLAWAVQSNGNVIALGVLGHTAALNLASNQWHRLPDFFERALVLPQLVTIADRIVIVIGEPRVLNADRTTWQLGPKTPRPGGPIARLAWTGRELYAIGGQGDFAKYIPPNPIN